MLELGGNIYFTAKLGATDGHSFQHLAAVMTGSSQQDYAGMMLGGGRPIEGNRSRSGRNAPSKYLAAETAPKKPKRKTAGSRAAKPKSAKPKSVKPKSIKPKSGKKSKAKSKSAKRK
jgi:hypothetical protein